MSISFQKTERQFVLHTDHTSYILRIDPFGHPVHVYYGKRISDRGAIPSPMPMDRGFSPNPYDTHLDRTLSPDTMCQEYAGFHNGDYRVSGAEVYDEGGVGSLDFRYVSHEIQQGKYELSGLPGVRNNSQQAMTLILRLRDAVMGLEVELCYGVLPETDTITRCTVLTNRGEKTLRVEKAASCCLDIPTGKWELIHFHGRHAMERKLERLPLMHGIQTVGSRRGASSHHHNPFVILSKPETTEDFGSCCGFLLLYSGSHKTEIEVDQIGQTRLVTGINPDDFSWQLKAGESFVTPECAMIYSADGLSKLSHQYHRLIRDHICPERFAQKRSPILINNWEATYFDFNEQKLLDIARTASALGVELFVLDDGWFGKRDSDRSGLGDWTVNEEKIQGGLGALIEKINAMGMQFGLWVEPEMVSEDSDLFRAHPDWALTVPGRDPVLSRHQLVLDLAKEEVVEYLYAQLSALFSAYPIAYVKWDMNRNIADIYSDSLPAHRQGELLHRYILGLYRLLERLTTQFPQIRFEGCAGGGGRFDAGMLYYTPQIWCSDNTDAIERLTIQYGTSFAYPVSAVGAHVSAVPNHQTGRQTPLGTRAVVAMSGTFGYELNLDCLTEEEKNAVREQIQTCIRYSDLIRNGDYYRLTDDSSAEDCMAWQFVSRDGKEALLNAVITHTAANAAPICIPLRGLDPEGLYRVEHADFSGCTNLREIETYQKGSPEVYSGSGLMYAGYYLPYAMGDYPGIQIHFVRCD